MLEDRCLLETLKVWFGRCIVYISDSASIRVLRIDLRCVC